jgi:hypothetical protein
VKGLPRLVDLELRLRAVEDDLEFVGAVLDDVRDGSGLLTGGSPPDRSGRAAHEPQDEPTGPYFPTLLEFVTEGFTPVYCRATSPSLRWCPMWWDHAEALYRLEALWRTWELYRLEPRLGIASWLRDYLDPQLTALTSPTGPFAQCTDDRHSPIKPLRTEYPPEGYFDEP